MSKSRFRTITIADGQVVRGIMGMTVIGIKQGATTELVLEAPERTAKKQARKPKPAANKSTSFDPETITEK